MKAIFFITTLFALATSLGMENSSRLFGALSHASVNAKPVFGHCTFSVETSSRYSDDKKGCEGIVGDNRNGAAQCAMNEAIKNCQTLYGNCGALLNYGAGLNLVGSDVVSYSAGSNSVDSKNICKVSAYVYGTDARFDVVKKSEIDWKREITEYFRSKDAQSISEFYTAAQVFKNLPFYRATAGTPIFSVFEPETRHFEYLYYSIQDQVSKKIPICGLDLMAITKSPLFTAMNSNSRQNKLSARAEKITSWLRTYYAACVIEDYEKVKQTLEVFSHFTAQSLKELYGQTGIFDFEKTFPRRPEMIYFK